MAAAGSDSAAEVRAGMLAAGSAPVAKVLPFSQTVEVAGVTHTLNDEYQWLRGKAWPKLVEDKVGTLPPACGILNPPTCDNGLLSGRQH